MSIDLFGLTKPQEVKWRGSLFAFVPLNIDISGQFDKPAGTVIMTHKIEGFVEEIYLVIDSDPEEGGFFFGTKVFETGGVNGLFVVLQDESLKTAAYELLYSATEQPE
jgi:hypothetical protein